MVDGDFFDKLDAIGRKVRKRENAPFGEIQVILTGDFFQLPPVVNASKIKAKFAFEARAWSTCFDKTHRLTHVFRQSDSGTLSSSLAEVGAYIIHMTNRH